MGAGTATAGSGVRTMRVGVDIREWQPGRRTGIGRLLEEFLRAASAARPHGRFLLVGDASCEVRVQGDTLDVLRIPERCTVWWDQVALPRALARAGVDVLYSPYIKVPLLGSVPVVSTFHDLTFLRGGLRSWRPVDFLLNPPFSLFCWAVVRRAAAVLVDSVTSARDVQRALGTDPAKLRVIPLATSAAFRLDADARADAGVLRRYGLAGDYVLYVGGFGRHKNVPCLVRAHAALPTPLRVKHPLVLVGGPLPADLRRLLGEPEAAAATQCVGVVPDADLAALYRGAALCAFPSRYEGFGLPVLEAMACGRPVLCSTAPALLELTGGAALHVDPGDGPGWERGLLVLLTDRGRREALAAAGHARASAYSPDRMAREILKVLDEVAGCRR